MPHSTVTSFERYKTRHAFVSGRAGVDMAIAMKITGHRTIDVFLRYNIISIDQLHQAMGRVTSRKTGTK